VGDHQRIPAVVCFLFLASVPCSAQPFVSAIIEHFVHFAGWGVAIYYAWMTETHDYEKGVALHGELSSFCG
jgi:hypothetical protein